MRFVVGERKTESATPEDQQSTIVLAAAGDPAAGKT
jgi:hypothetical protein